MFKLNIISDDSLPTNEYNSHLSLDYLEKYGNGSTFVETGTYLGNTVRLAKDFGFMKIYSIELNDNLYNDAKEMFKDDQSIVIMHGDSSDCLDEIVKNLQEPATFWLDAHASGNLAGGKAGGSPVLDELEIIAKSPIKTHTIFIDDRRLFGSSEWSYVKEEDAINLIKKINPDYNIHFLDGHIRNDVICATVR